MMYIPVSMTTTDLARIRKVVGAGSLLSLRRGGTLNKWTRSVPRNVWVESTRGKMLWHSSHGEAPPWEFFELVRIENEGCSYVYQLKKQYWLYSAPKSTSGDTDLT